MIILAIFWSYNKVHEKSDLQVLENLDVCRVLASKFRDNII